MLSSPPSALPSRARTARRIALPVAVAASLVAGALSATALSPGASAATAGTYTIGDAPTPLNQPTDPGIGRLTPTEDAATNGMFGPQVAWPLIPLHSVIARNGHLVSYGTPLNTADQGGLAYDDWDPTAGFSAAAHVDSASMHGYNAFCNGLVSLPDGRLLMVGGNSTMSTMIYDPKTAAQTMATDLSQQRWYATALRLPDQRILVLGGADYYNSVAYQNPDNNNGVAMTPEIGDGTGAWTALTGAADPYAFGARDNRWWYPRAFNGPNGTVVGFSNANIWSLSTTGAGSLQATGQLPFNPGVAGSQVMYAPGKVLVAGGGQVVTEDENAATNAAAVIDFNGAKPAVTSIAPMTEARNWLNLTVLPTGEVFANGGTKVGLLPGDDNSVKQTEIWNPETGQWRTAATAQRTRTYHQVALVMPSGGVFTGGGGVPGPESNLNAEMFYPSYLFTKGADGVTRWASRPTITSIAGSATYGGEIRLTTGDDRGISKASLINLPSETHAQNTDQRRIELKFSRQGNAVTASLPDDVNAMPPGDYTLSVVDDKGVASPSQILTIRPGAAGLVTVAGAEGVADNGGAVTDPGTTAGTTEGGTTPDPGKAAITAVALKFDKTVGLEPAARLGSRVSASGRTVTVVRTNAASKKSDRDRSSWVARPGLYSASGVSFESLTRPGYYLLAPSTAGKPATLARNDRSKAFAGRATFEPAKIGQTTSFLVWSKKSYRLQVSGSKLTAKRFTGSEAAKGVSTFTVREALSPARPIAVTTSRSIGLAPSDAGGNLIQHSGTKVSLRTVGAGSSKTLKGRSAWVIRAGAGTKSGVLLESTDRPGWFLAASKTGSGALAVVKRSSTARFTARATFVATKGASGADTSLRLASRTNLYMQHLGKALRLDTLDTSTRGRASATFVVRSGMSPAPFK